MCAAGAETTPWKNPSSSGQLPVPVALNAGSPTLFANNIHQRKGFVNTHLKNIPPRLRTGI